MTKELEFPLSLCVQMLHYCVWNNKLTEDMRLSEIKEYLGYFFTEDLIEEAQKIMIGEKENEK